MARTLYLHCSDCGLDIEVTGASPEGERRISGTMNCPACLVPLALASDVGRGAMSVLPKRAEQGPGVKGAGGGEPPAVCPIHGVKPPCRWAPSDNAHGVCVPAPLGSRPSVITAPVERALEAIRERWGQAPKSKGKK